ncbi:hypothetical protein BJ508DRAFT_85839 [Ascobolus immersus RN42]|uniref:P-loop containing nucleoside triphosphate hydrolase protein n=1 Tax=Ascobolus immersus RN42 TaxID=1160509 RepID=A0A3N4ICZ4_ASCIM|nr:hypothetical protein BJ508DRAFT_85839 [Ascobolus immersus RN42]
MDDAPALTPPESPTITEGVQQENPIATSAADEDGDDESVDMDISSSQEQKAAAEQLEMELSANSSAEKTAGKPVEDEDLPPPSGLEKGEERKEPEDGEVSNTPEPTEMANILPPELEDGEDAEEAEEGEAPNVSKPLEPKPTEQTAPEASVPTPAASDHGDGENGELKAVKEEAASPGPIFDSGPFVGGNEAEPIVIDDSDEEKEKEKEAEEDQLIELKARQVKKDYLSTFEGREAEISSRDFEKATFAIKYQSDKKDYFTLKLLLSKVHRDQAHVFSNPAEGWAVFQQKVKDNIPKAMKDKCISYTVECRIPDGRQSSWHDIPLAIDSEDASKWLSIVRAILVLHHRECVVVVKGTPVLEVDDDRLSTSIKAKRNGSREPSSVSGRQGRMSEHRTGGSSRVMSRYRYADSYLPRKRVLASDILYSELDKNRRITGDFYLAPLLGPVKGMNMKEFVPGNQIFHWKVMQRLLHDPVVDGPKGKGRNGRFKQKPRFSKESHAKIMQRYPVEQDEEELGDDSEPVQSLFDMIANREDAFDPDQLKKWETMENDREIPVFGESGDEGEYDDQTLREMEREELEKAGAKQEVKKKLSVEEIQVIVQDAIRRYQTLWATDKKPELDKKALKTWNEGRDPYRRARAPILLEQATTALQKLAKGFEDTEYPSEDVLKAKTDSLQNSVYNVETRKWTLDIYNLPTAPSKKGVPLPSKEAPEAESAAEDITSTNTNGKKGPRTRSRSRSGVANSESDDDGLDDFIVDDDDDARIDLDLADEFMPGMKESGCTLEALANQQSWTDSGPDKELWEYLKTCDREKLYKGVETCLEDPDNCTSDDTFRDSLIAVYLAKNFHLSDPNEIQFPIPKHQVDDIRNLGWPGFQYYLEDCDRFLDEHFRKKKERREARKKLQGNKRRRGRVALDSEDDDDSSVAGESDEDEEDEDEGREGPMDQFVKSKKGKGKQKGSGTEDKPKGRKEIKEDAGAAAQRRKHANLVDDWEARRKEAQARQATQLAQSTGTKIMINEGHPDGVEDIYIHPAFSKIIKGYQAEGVQFLWREIVGVQLCKGALLSHTMGLGKTFQVIVLLFTLASALSNDKMKADIPEILHSRRFMVLCPPSLLANWADEIKKRVPKDEMEILGPILTLSAPQGKTLKRALMEKEAEVRHWFKYGGVILMGYEAFKTVVFNKPSKSGAKAPPFTEEEHKRWREYLVNPGPALVVADEAHTLKNSKTDISTAAAAFKTTSRVAMTGSPLSNNLEEYYSMIDWIHPGYLGPIKEFRINYIGFIQDGMFAESSQLERSRARVKLETLNKLLEKKCHRKDITALAEELPTKNEFVIKIPLTEVQMQLYNWYLSRKRSDNQLRILGVLKRLQMICNHPAILIRQLRSVKKKLKGLSEIIDEVEDEDDEVEVGEDGKVNISRSKKMAEEALEFMKTVNPEGFDINALENSHRMVLLIEILKKSAKVNDKVLVFSHQLSTIEYVKEQLQKEGITAAVLTGSTVMNTRQDAINNFNKKSNNTTVFLMSTKAGGIGLNITGANRVVILDTEFNPTWDEQAVGRAYRIGQKKPVFVYRFQSLGTFEVALAAQGTFKLQLQDKVIDKRTWTTRADRKGMRQYMIDASIPERPAEEIAEEITLKDVILHGLCGSAKAVYGVDNTETFKVDVREDLTAEELQEVQTAVELEELRVNDPDEWKKRVHFLDPTDEARRIKDEARRQSLHGQALQVPPAPRPQPQQNTSSSASSQKAAAAASDGFRTLKDLTKNPSTMNPPATPAFNRPSSSVTKTVITPSNLQNARATPSAIRTPSGTRTPSASTPIRPIDSTKTGPPSLRRTDELRMKAKRMLEKNKQRDSTPTGTPRATRSSATPSRSSTSTPVSGKKRSLDAGSNSSSSSGKKSKH